MIAFWDSSAFLKLLVDEGGSADAERTWNEVPRGTASRLAFPEVSAALSAARRAGRLEISDERRARGRWAEYVAMIDVIELTEAVATRAAKLASEHVLSGADAVHLASALAMSEVDTVLVTWDRRLRSAATALGLAVVPGVVTGRSALRSVCNTAHETLKRTHLGRDGGPGA